MAQAAPLVLSVGWAVRAVQCQQRPYDAILMCRHAPVLIADTKCALLPNLYCKGKLPQHDGQQRITARRTVHPMGDPELAAAWMGR